MAVARRSAAETNHGWTNGRHDTDAGWLVSPMEMTMKVTVTRLWVKRVATSGKTGYWNWPVVVCRARVCPVQAEERNCGKKPRHAADRGLGRPCRTVSHHRNRPLPSNPSDRLVRRHRCNGIRGRRATIVIPPSAVSLEHRPNEKVGSVQKSEAKATTIHHRCAE